MRYPQMFLISGRIRQVFEENGLTGWKAFDVVVWKKDGEQQVTGYNGFTVTGRLPERWNPDDAEIPDFFNLESTLYVICSQKVYDAIKKNKIKCFEVDLIDKERCEDIFDFRKNYIKKKTFDPTRFFERVYESLTSGDGPEKGKTKK